MNLLLVIAGVLCAAEPGLVRFDLEKCLADLPDDSVLRYDVVKMTASLQGVVNRDGPRLAVRFLHGAGTNIDDYWFTKLREGWLKDLPVEEVNSLEDLLSRFAGDIDGVVVWDPAVVATANVAATVCGVEGWLPVRADSALYARIVEGGPHLPVRLSLVGKFDGSISGSAKIDAYQWAKENYLDKGKCHPALLAYFIDAYTQQPGTPGFHYPDLFNATLANHDYYIANRAFFFDLSPWADEAPVDDPRQPLGADKQMLTAILRDQVERNAGKAFTTVGGFVPWNLKYTSHGAAGGKHEPVPSEWEYAGILSAHNAIMDADALGLACLTNASAYMHFPLQPRYEQNARPVPGELEPKTYVLVYMGDYDSAAWLSSNIPSIWDDPARGQMPMAWAFNPNLAARVPYVFDHVYRTKTANDWFIGGDSGAGYLNPNLLTGQRLGSGVPDALDMWVQHNLESYGRFDYDITGFVINGFHGDMPLAVQEAYSRFSPRGVGMQLGFAQPVVNGTPFLRHVSDIYPKRDKLGETAAEMVRFAKPEKPQFLIYRMILQRPGTVMAVRDHLNADYPDARWEFCDPYTFFDLYKRSLGAE
ncbi:MAG: hypothetical protein IT364_15985 [Candidatus Hydrogenedentes bacterium]|nr:hypothetical protein [Candidatus Hydrogenedentota bacterium]